MSLESSVELLSRSSMGAIAFITIQEVVSLKRAWEQQPKVERSVTQVM